MRKILIEISTSENKYPELRKIVDMVSRITTRAINDEIKKVNSDMPYKAQWVLEELIKDLEKRV